MLRRRRPPPPLDQFVESVMLFEMPAPAHARERALPDGCAQLVINLQGMKHGFTTDATANIAIDTTGLC